MGLVFTYDWRKYSAKDIKEYLERLGYSVRYELRNYCEFGFWFVDELHLSIRPPHLNGNKVSGIPDVYWENDDTVYKHIDTLNFKNDPNLKWLVENRRKRNGIDVNDLLSEEIYQKHHKVYLRLQRKFHLPRNQYFGPLKDIDWHTACADAVRPPSFFGYVKRWAERRYDWLMVLERYIDIASLVLWAIFHPHILWRDREWLFNSGPLKWHARLRRLSIPPLQFNGRVVKEVNDKED